MEAPQLKGFSVKWVHPRLARRLSVRVDDAQAATKLAAAFDAYHVPLDGTPYDCPMYDAIITLYAEGARPTKLKVYLPRDRAFPGMWKHPSGPLCYFDVDKGEAKMLVDCLRPFIPRDPVYPTEMADWPPVAFTLGIPDFTTVDYPIRGDFPRGYFTRGVR